MCCAADPLDARKSESARKVAAPPPTLARKRLLPSMGVPFGEASPLIPHRKIVKSRGFFRAPGRTAERVAAWYEAPNGVRVD
jgi:hypothetical protein